MPRWSWILDPGTGGLATMSTAARRLPDSSTATAIDYRRPSCRFCGDRWYLIPWRGGDMIPSRRLTSEHPPRRRVVLWTRGHEAGSFACLVSCPPAYYHHLTSSPARNVRLHQELPQADPAHQSTFGTTTTLRRPVRDRISPSYLA